MIEKAFVCRKETSCEDCDYKIVSYFPYSEAEQAAVRKPRKQKFRATLPQKKSLNDRRSQDLFGLLLQANFNAGDLFLTLTFEAKLSVEERQRLFKNFLNRLRRYFRKFGLALKYLTVKEFGKNNDNLHYHLIINSGDGVITSGAIKALWGNGFCDVSVISKRKDGLLGIALYLGKERNVGKFERAWSPSTNLKRPDVFVDKSATIAMKHLKKIIEAKRNDEVKKVVEEILYRGWRLVYHSVSQSELTGRNYVQLKLMRKTELPQEGTRDYDDYIPPLAVNTYDWDSILVRRNEPVPLQTEAPAVNAFQMTKSEQEIYERALRKVREQTETPAVNALRKQKRQDKHTSVIWENGVAYEVFTTSSMTREELEIYERALRKIREKKYREFDGVRFRTKSY